MPNVEETQVDHSGKSFQIPESVVGNVNVSQMDKVLNHVNVGETPGKDMYVCILS